MQRIVWWDGQHLRCTGALRAIRMAACVALAICGVAAADLIEWDGGPAGTGKTLNDDVNWVGDVLPGEGDDAILPNGAPNGDTVKLSGDWRVGSLTTTRSSLLLYSSSSPGKALILTGGGQGLLLAADGKADVHFSHSYSIASSINVVLAGSGDMYASADAQALTVSAPISELGGSQGFTKTGPGTLVLDAASTYSGQTVVADGRLVVVKAGGLGSATGNTSVLPGATLDLSAIGTISEPLVLSGDGFDAQGALLAGAVHNGTIVLAGDSTIAAGSRAPGATPTSCRLTASIGETGGSHSLRKIGPNALWLEATASYTGETIIEEGSVELAAAAASLASSSALRIRGGGDLHATYPNGGNMDRIRGDVTLEGGSLRFTRNGSTTLEESYGQLSVGPGTSLLQIENTIGTTVVGNGLAQEPCGTIVFAGSKLGAAPTVAGYSRILFINSPTDLLVGGGGSAGSPSISILPFAWGQSGTYSASQIGSFVTYDSNGIRLLDLNTEYAVLSSALPNQNARSTGETVNNAKEVNSLLFTGGALSGTGSLAIRSGALAGSGTISVHDLNFGNADGIVAFNGTISSNIAGSGNVVVRAGSGGTLAISGVNTFGGPGKGIYVNDGTLSVTGNASLGDPANTVVLNSGATLSLGAFSTDHPIVLSGGTAHVKGTTGADVVGPISGSGSLDVPKAPLGLSGVNTYTGGTTLWNGTTVLLGSDQAFGTGTVMFASDDPNMSQATTLRAEGGARRISAPVVFYSGRLSADGPNPLIFSGPVRSGTALTVSDPAGEVRFEQPVTGGGFWKYGPGAVVLNADNPELYMIWNDGPLVLRGALKRMDGQGGVLRPEGDKPITVGSISVLSKNFKIGGDADLTIGYFNSGLALSDATIVENAQITRFSLGFTGHLRKTGPGELELDGSINPNTAIVTLEEGMLTLRTSTWPKVNVYGGTIRAAVPLTMASSSIYAYDDFEIGGNTDLTLSNVILQNEVVVTVTNTGRTTASISGGLTKMGPGALNVSGGTLSRWTVAEGVLEVNGPLQSNWYEDHYLDIASGSELRGAGQIIAPVKGQGMLSPGQRDGILAIDAMDPSNGLDIALEFTSAGAPAYGNRSASLNDILAFATTTPFLSPLGAQNRVDVCFDVPALEPGDVFKGGFYVAGIQPTELLSQLQGDDMAFWIADPAGPKLFNGMTYSSLDPALINIGAVYENTGMRFWLNFPSTGSITTFTVVPEPGLGLCTAGLALWSLLRHGRTGTRRTVGAVQEGENAGRRRSIPS